MMCEVGEHYDEGYIENCSQHTAADVVAGPNPASPQDSIACLVLHQFVEVFCHHHDCDVIVLIESAQQLSGFSHIYG